MDTGLGKDSLSIITQGNFSSFAIIITINSFAITYDLKETEFRNKYLLGTLTSLVLALLIFVIFNEL